MPKDNPLPDMEEADATNGEPGATDTSDERPAPRRTGEDQAARNREDDPPA